MFPHLNKPSSLNSQLSAPQFPLPYNFSLPVVKSPNNQTTSLDGRPFVTPEQFGSLMIKERQGSLNKTFNALAIQNQLRYKAMLNKTALDPFWLKSELAKRPSQGIDDDYNVYKKLKGTSDNLEIISLEDDVDYLKQDYKSNEKGESYQEIQTSPIKTICKTTQPTKQSHKRFVKKIYGVQYEESQQDLIFKVDLHPEDEGNLSLEARLSRKDLIERDPLSLLYFYEQQLQFSNTPEFNPQNLIKF